MNVIYNVKNGLEGLEGVRDRTAFRSTVALPYKTYPKTKFSENSTDVFGELVIKAWYDAKNCLCGVQLYHPNASFFYEELQILGLSIQEVEDFFSTKGILFEVEEDKSGVRVNRGSVRIYAPDMMDVGGTAKVEAVYVSIP